MITPKIKNSLEPQSIGAVLLACYLPHSLKPQPQGLSAIVKDRSCSYRSLTSAFSTLIKCALRLPRIIIPTLGATKPSRPTKRCQIVKAGIFRNKPFLELDKCSRIIFHSHILHVVCGGVKCIAPLSFSFLYPFFMIYSLHIAYRCL